jgi:hypothetical protein
MNSISLGQGDGGAAVGRGPTRKALGEVGLAAKRRVAKSAVAGMRSEVEKRRIRYGSCGVGSRVRAASGL